MSWKRPGVEDRMMTFLEKLPKTIKGTAIDLGTGGGIFAKLLSDQFPHLQVHKLDNRRYTNLSDLATQAVIQAIPYRHSSFDVMICAQVLHYIPAENQEEVINSLLSYLKQGGILIIVEYIVSRSYSWIPYPVHVDDLKDYSTQVPLTTIIYDDDPRRPKYGAYYSTRQV